MSEEMKDVNVNVNVKYVKVCDRHGYCVMKIKPEEVSLSSNRKQKQEQKQKYLGDAKTKRSNLIRTQKQNTGKIIFEKETQLEVDHKHDKYDKHDKHDKFAAQQKQQNLFISKISNKPRGILKGMRVDDITLTTTKDHASE